MMDELADKETRVARSIEMSAKLVSELKPMCQGVHMMPLGWDKHVPTILQQAGVLQ